VEGGLVEVVSTVEYEKWYDKDDDKRGYLLEDRDC
jgi:hypothetical protein